MSTNMTDNPLAVRIIRQNNKFRLELENASDRNLTDIEISPIFVQGYEEVNQNIMIEFERVSSLSPGERISVTHQTYFPKAPPIDGDNLWEEADDFYDFLMCLTPKLSRGIAYELNISFRVEGESAYQTIAAGANSGLDAIYA